MIGIYLCDDEDAVRHQIQTALEQKILAEDYEGCVQCRRCAGTARRSGKR